MGKLKKGKHNHLLTDLLKFTIFSIVMLAPFLAVLSKCLYVSMNKNAYQSYSGNSEFTYYEKTTYETNSVASKNDLIEGNIYRFAPWDDEFGFIWYELGNFTVNNVVGFYIPNDYNAYFDEFSNGLFLTSYSQVCYVTLKNSIEVGVFWDTVEDDSLTYVIEDFSFVENDFYFYFLYKSDTFNASLLDEDYLYYCIYSADNYVLEKFAVYEEKTLEQSTLDNVFEYSVNQLSQMQLFNWTTNTAIYTPIEATTQGLGFNPQNNTLAILLTYWTLNTAIYIIFDIVIYCFTKLTHITQE